MSWSRSESDVDIGIASGCGYGWRGSGSGRGASWTCHRPPRPGLVFPFVPWAALLCSLFLARRSCDNQFFPSHRSFRGGVRADVCLGWLSLRLGTLRCSNTATSIRAFLASLSIPVSNKAVGLGADPSLMRIPLLPLALPFPALSLLLPFPFPISLFLSLSLRPLSLFLFLPLPVLPFRNLSFNRFKLCPCVGLPLLFFSLSLFLALCTLFDGQLPHNLGLVLSAVLGWGTTRRGTTRRGTTRRSQILTGSADHWGLVCRHFSWCWRRSWLRFRPHKAVLGCCCSACSRPVRFENRDGSRPGPTTALLHGLHGML